MNRCLAARILLLVGLTLASPLAAQDSFEGVDLLYPEFAHPRADARAAIERGDLRFVATDRHRTTPGVERYGRLKEIYGTKIIRQRFRLFPSRSDNFSFNLRARTYATEYNQTLLQYLQALPAKK